MVTLLRHSGTASALFWKTSYSVKCKESDYTACHTDPFWENVADVEKKTSIGIRLKLGYNSIFLTNI